MLYFFQMYNLNLVQIQECISLNGHIAIYTNTPFFVQYLVETTKAACSEEPIRPSEAAFLHYLPQFLKSNPTARCAKGGHAAYAQVMA